MYVSPAGSDSAGNGSVQAPFLTVRKAYAVATSGDSIVLRGGTYPVTGNGLSSLAKSGVSIRSYPGEVATFDGSRAVSGPVSSEGSLRVVSYQPMPAALGEGLGLTNLPRATFSGTTPTGLAASRGWRCATSSSYSDPGAVSSGNPSGCASGTTATIVSGYFPDQVWVDGRALTQVMDKSLVKQGTFFVPRSAATDAAPPLSSLYLSAEDAVDMSKVRVSSSTGNFWVVQADNVRIEGVRIVNHSPTWAQYSVVATEGVDDFVMKDVELDSNASIAVKLAGGSAAGGGQLMRRALLQRVSATRSGWSGLVSLYTDDTVVRDSVFDRSNADAEFTGTPQVGGIKATKNDRMRIINVRANNNGGPGVWWDQSNYDVVLADSEVSGNTDSGVFFEISHGLTMVNTLIANNTGGPGLQAGGSSGLKLVNNTLVGGQDVIKVYTDARSRTYGTDNRPCSEHTVRYRQGGTLSDCNIGYSSDLDQARSGAYGTVNQTPGMNWMPAIDMMVNNILANPSSSGTCGVVTTVCIIGYLNWNGLTAQVPTNTIVRPGTVMDGNLYQTGNNLVKVHTASGQAGGFTANSLAAVKGTSGFGSNFYNKNVETAGKAAPIGTWVTGNGTATATLDGLHDQAYPVPTDPLVNTYLPAGTRHYGTLS